jgi:hypothetical protein
LKLAISGQVTSTSVTLLSPKLTQGKVSLRHATKKGRYAEVLLLLTLTFIPAAMPPGIPDEKAPRTTPVDVLREAHGHLPPATPPLASPPVIDTVDLAKRGRSEPSDRVAASGSSILKPASPSPLPDEKVAARSEHLA